MDWVNGNFMIENLALNPIIDKIRKLSLRNSKIPFARI